MAEHSEEVIDRLPGQLLPAQPGPQKPAALRPERSETGVWVGISAIVMCFAAFSSAMIVRQGASTDWRHFGLPPILYLNTLVLLGSSATLLLARRRLAALRRATGEQARSLYADGISWLVLTLALGGFFLCGQLVAWRILAAQGLYLSSNPSASFFYVFTAMHALHLLGGLAALVYLLVKLSRTNGTAQTTGLPALCLYWHFMDGLWLYLLILLLVRT